MKEANIKSSQIVCLHLYNILKQKLTVIIFQRVEIELWLPGVKDGEKRDWKEIAWRSFLRFCFLLSISIMGVTIQLCACVKIHTENKRPRMAKTIWRHEVEGQALSVIIVQSLSRFRLFVTPWTAARPASLSFTISWSLLKLIIHWVSDAVQASHPLLSPSPPAFNLSQHQGLF